MARQNRCSKWIRKSTRFGIYARDGFKCVYCKAKDKLTLDHYRPNNDHAPRNLLTSCLSCNCKKGNKSVRTWLADLRSNGVRTEAVRSRIWRRLSKAVDRVAGRELAKACTRA